MDNIPVKFVSSTRVLGVTLDSKWLFHEHISKQCTKAKRMIFMIIKHCSIKWGLNQTVLNTIWVSYIQPVLLYLPLTWISSVEKQRCQKQLESVQRIFAIKMIKSFKTVSYETSITLSKLVPVMQSCHQIALCSATKRIQQLETNVMSISVIQNLKSKYKLEDSNYDFLTKENNYIENDNLNISIDNDKCISKLSIYKQLTVNNTLNIFTDGSKTSEHTGCASVIYLNKFKKVVILNKLDINNSIFQAETSALYISLMYVSYIRINEYERINIFTDSMSLLKSLQNTKRSTNLISITRKLLSLLLKSGHNINLCWCPSHSDIEGNEVADHYAKSTASLNTITYVPLPISYLKSVIKTNGRIIWKDRWTHSNNSSTTKLSISMKCLL